ncbi:hypothetical protein GT025_19575 [Streptomyces sp. SID4920]|nr:hypothetical protein [Streptomyces sp. SID4920]MYX63685.1 hypothetical protein [Streptomyces sp. SID8373]
MPEIVETDAAQPGVVEQGVEVPGESGALDRGAVGLAAAVLLILGQGVPALVWDERYGWRTATNGRHPIGKDTGARPEGDGIRYLAASAHPAPECRFVGGVVAVRVVSCAGGIPVSTRLCECGLVGLWAL